MKEFLKALLNVVIFQIIYWLLIIICNEQNLSNLNENIMIILSIALSLIEIIHYFIVEKKTKEKGYNLTKLSISYLIMWPIITIGITVLLIFLTDSNIILKGAGGFLSGIEYLLFGFCLAISAIIALIIKLIIYISKILKKN